MTLQKEREVRLKEEAVWKQKSKSKGDPQKRGKEMHSVQPCRKEEQ